MTRRVQTLITGVVTLVVLAVALVFLPLPYVALVPGPTVNTIGDYQDKPVIVVDGKEVNQSAGNLNLTTVGVQDQITIFQAIAGWFSDDMAIVPRETVYPPDKTRDETDKENRTQYVESENSAIAAALSYLGYPQKVVVVEPRDGVALKAGDAIEAVNGQPTPNVDALAAVMSQIPPGTAVTVAFLSDGQPQQATVTTNEPPAGDGRSGSLLGIVVGDRYYAGFSVSFSQNDIGGPSAGLMLTLGIINLVGPEPIIDDEFIAGTGTISPDGAVGPIGGIRFKLKRATSVGAELFLTPADNCAEAMIDPPEGAPTLAKVSNLNEALAAIEKFRAGEDVPTC
ncbi:hypothetical protein EK0264_15825 [Epidermidibacterium keratini]|uniref:Lon proteolytic domain-containing protein n=1 Tax=Epidermidibacterium keratini TaxID=1891644 RepID=A0A7L4YRM9_9ACTN|nr:S16 family serine protease [Epidermidibacterium keratini]QHC01613.1 hypothetical protein EK0264_15825 [Epidermidibacterium keratini]